MPQLSGTLGWVKKGGFRVVRLKITNPSEIKEMRSPQITGKLIIT